MKEKQIEEMAEHCEHLSGGKCLGEYECDLMCSMFGTFQRLANAGYRKQRDLYWFEEGKPLVRIETSGVIPTKKWISVEESLPSKSGYYLICQKSSRWCDEVIQTARWNEQKFRGAQAGCFMEHVTHWMPLPDAPKMKGI